MKIRTAEDKVLERLDKKLNAIKRELNYSVNLNNRKNEIKKSKSTDYIK